MKTFLDWLMLVIVVELILLAPVLANETSSFDPAPYMGELQRRIRRAWFPPKAPESRTVTIRFNIHSGGEMSDLVIKQSSGNAVFDRAALQAATNASPFRPLPTGAPSEVVIDFPFDVKAFGRQSRMLDARTKKTLGTDYTVQRTSTPPSGEFETYDFPYIKWKPKLLPSGELVQLETTINDLDSTEYAYRANVKYKVHALIQAKSQISGQGLRFELLDDKGFGLSRFDVPGSEFAFVTGTSVLEARGAFAVSENDYRKAVDYAVK